MLIISMFMLKYVYFSINVYTIYIAPYILYLYIKMTQGKYFNIVDVFIYLTTSQF